ncbi:lytic transglycosylase domain-containing protein [Roseomonas mucosa]|nr:lytic transglycosylase domain-containing protein [Roseomonas mucosa]
MAMLRCLTLLLILLASIAGARAQTSAPSPSTLCRAAIAAAEREYGLPAGLLAAIGRVESGRRDPETGERGPWPWTMNAEGRGKFFRTKAEAVAEVRQLRADGMRLIDVGCMQINLHHHPNAFASLEEAFDPLSNARYAARFLKDLNATRGDWMRSAANYHSNTPERAAAYLAAVEAQLPEARREAGLAPSWNPGWNPAGRAPGGAATRLTMGQPVGGHPVGGQPVGRGLPFGGVPYAGAPAVVNRMPVAGAALGGMAGGTPGGTSSGRGLAAYRAVPIPLATRTPVAGRG